MHAQGVHERSVFRSPPSISATGTHGTGNNQRQRDAGFSGSASNGGVNRLSGAGSTPSQSHRSVLSVVMGGPAAVANPIAALAGTPVEPRRQSQTPVASSSNGSAHNLLANRSLVLERPPAIANNNNAPPPAAAVQEQQRRATLPANNNTAFKGRAARVQWTDDEVNALEEGLKRFGRQWAMILSHYRRRFHAVRTAVDLKDKARNEKRRRQRANLELGPWHVAC